MATLDKSSEKLNEKEKRKRKQFQIPNPKPFITSIILLSHVKTPLCHIKIIYVSLSKWKNKMEVDKT